MPQDPDSEKPAIVFQVAPEHAEEVYRVLLRMAEDAEASPVDRFVMEWEAWAQQILAAAALPTWDAIVRLQENGQWALVLPGDASTHAGVGRPGEALCTVGVLSAHLYGYKSKEHYAYLIRSYWIPGSWNVRMVYTDAIPFYDP